MAAEVFFTDMRARQGLNMLDKLERLFDAAGLGEIISPGDLVALKVHFGERGNTGYVRPQFIRRVVDKVKARGGKPFLTDANTLYVGSRANAVDHIQTAIENGFDFAVVGAPIVIADGLTGKDYRHVEINGKHFREVKIGTAVLDADAIIAITHFKGHEMTGFGGTLKNLGMGLGSRSGKQQMHSDVKPQIDQEKCIGCEKCQEWCPGAAIYTEGEKSVIDKEKCIGCGECTVTCPVRAIAIRWETKPDVIQEKIVEYTMGVLKGKEGKAGFITFLTNVTPDCDCCSWSDAPVVADIGILASKDPVALDQACVDLVMQARGNPASALGRDDVEDKFRALHPDIDWRVQLEYGEKMGLGTREYKLIKV